MQFQEQNNQHNVYLNYITHSSPVELVDDPLYIDIFWGIYEGKTYKEAFGLEKEGDYMLHPEN